MNKIFSKLAFVAAFAAVASFVTTIDMFAANAGGKKKHKGHHAK